MGGGALAVSQSPNPPVPTHQSPKIRFYLSWPGLPGALYSRGKTAAGMVVRPLLLVSLAVETTAAPIHIILSVIDE